MALSQLIWPLYGQGTKKGLGTINIEKTQEIERFAHIEILVRQNTVIQPLSIFLRFTIIFIAHMKRDIGRGIILQNILSAVK